MIGKTNFWQNYGKNGAQNEKGHGGDAVTP